MTPPTEFECSNMSATASESDLDPNPTTPQLQPHPQDPDPPQEQSLEDTTSTFDITYPYFPNRIIRTLSIAESSTRDGAETPDSVATYNYDAQPSLWESRHHQMAQDMEDMKQDIQRLFRQTIDMQQKHKRDLEKVKAKHESDIAELEARNTEKVEELVKSYGIKIERNSARIVELENKYDSEISRIQKENTERIEELRRAYDRKIEGNSERFRELERKYDSEIQQIKDKNAKRIKELIELIENYDDQINGIAEVHGTAQKSLQNEILLLEQKNVEKIEEVLKKHNDNAQKDLRTIQLRVDGIQQYTVTNKKKAITMELLFDGEIKKLKGDIKELEKKCVQIDTNVKLLDFVRDTKLKSLDKEIKSSNKKVTNEISEMKRSYDESFMNVKQELIGM